MPTAANNARLRYAKRPEQYLRSQNSSNSRQNRQSNASPLSRPLQFCTSKFIKGTIITMVLTTVLLIFYQGFFAKYQFMNLDLSLYKYDKHDENVQSAAKILRKCVDNYNSLLLLETQMSNFVQGERLSTLLKQKLQPFQDELTSLTSQTKKYEDMKTSNPRGGPPEQFISSSLARLENMENKFFDVVDADPEIKRVFKEDQVLANQMGEGTNKLLKEATFTSAVMYDEKLESEKIYIIPRPDVDSIDGGRYIDNLLLKHNYEEVIKLYEQLIAKLEKRDGYLEKIESLQSQEEIGIKEDVVDYYADLNHYNEILAKWIKKNDILLQLFYPHFTITMTKIGNIQQILLAYAGEGKKREGYINLKKILKDGISKLRLRISNLQYAYAKKAPFQSNVKP